MLLKQVTRPAYPPHIPRHRHACAVEKRWICGGCAKGEKMVIEKIKQIAL